MDYSAYVGLDVHKDTIAVAVARAGRDAPEYLGEIRNDVVSVDRLLKKLTPDGEVLSFCYEAGPCGYGLYHQVTGFGHDCAVVAPSLIPVKSGVRVKTDRRDSEGLAIGHRAGTLTAVWVPDQEQEAVRDLVRAREDCKIMERQTRQRLSGFLLRHGLSYAGKARWTLKHFAWLETVKFDNPFQQVVLQEYIDMVGQQTARVASLEDQMREALEVWSLRAMVEGFMALRGVNFLTAMTVAAELGDITRFDSPRQLSAFVGLTPSEHSSGGKRRLGAITKAGNGHVRRALVEASWAYRFPARKTRHLQAKAGHAPAEVQAIAWAAQKRLCARYRKQNQLGKPKQVVCTAVARELVGFLWAIAREVRGLPHNSHALRPKG